MPKIPFVDRTKSSSPKKSTSRPDFKLMCGDCKQFTRHTFETTVQIGIRVIDVVYECERCGANRVFGREETGPMKPGTEDVGDVAA